MSIRKRDWEASNGEIRTRWQVDYRDNAGTRRHKQFLRKKDAEAWLTDTAWQVAQGIHTAESQSITVKNAAMLWLKRCQEPNEQGRYLEDTTIASYEQHIRLHINPLCGGKKLTEINRPTAERYRNDLVEKLSSSMAKRVLRSLRAIFANAMRLGHVGQNVFDGVETIKSASRPEDIVIPSKNELMAAIDAASEYNDPIAEPLIMLMIFTGLRASELRGLAWPSIDLVNGLVTVNKRADSKGRLGPPKTKAGRRVIPLPRKTVSALKRWKLRCPQSDLELVFPSLKGKVMSHNYMLNNILRPVLNEAEMKEKYTLHTFRHATASLWIEQRIQPKRISTWMGHSSINVTYDRYGHLFDQVDIDHGAANAVEFGLLGQQVRK